MSSKAEVRSAQVARIGETPGLPGDVGIEASPKVATPPAGRQAVSEMFGTPGTRAGDLVPSLAAADTTGQPGVRRVVTVAPINQVLADEGQAETTVGTEVYAAAGRSTGQAGAARDFVTQQRAETPRTLRNPHDGGKGGDGSGGEIREQGDEDKPPDEILEKLKWVTKEDINKHAASRDRKHLGNAVNKYLFDLLRRNPAAAERAQLEHEAVDPDDPQSDRKVSFESLTRAVKETEKEWYEREGAITAIPGFGELLATFLKNFVQKREEQIDLREEVILHKRVLAGAEARRKADIDPQNRPTRIANSMRERVLLEDAERRFTESYEYRETTQEERSRKHTRVFLQGIYPDDSRIDNLPDEQAISLAGSNVSVYRDITGWGDAEHDADNATAYLNGFTLEEITAEDDDVVDVRATAGLVPLARWLHLENSRGTIGETRQNLNDMLESYLQDAGIDTQLARPIAAEQKIIYIDEIDEEPDDPVDARLKLVTEADLDAFAAHSPTAGRGGIVATRVKKQLFGIPIRAATDFSLKAQMDFQSWQDAGLKLSTGEIPGDEGELLSRPIPFESLQQVVHNEKVTEIPELAESSADFLRAFVEHREKLITLRKEVRWTEETVAGREEYVQEAELGTKQRVERLRNLIEYQIYKGQAERDFREAQNFGELTAKEVLAREHIATFLNAILRGHPRIADLPEENAQRLATRFIELYEVNCKERGGVVEARSNTVKKYITGEREDWNFAESIGHIGKWLHKFHGEGKTGSEVHELTSMLANYLPVQLEELSPAERARRTKEAKSMQDEVRRDRGERLEVPALEYRNAAFRGNEIFTDRSQLSVNVTFVEEKTRTAPGARVNVTTDLYHVRDGEYIVQPVELSMDFRPDSPNPTIAELGELVELGHAGKQIVAEVAAHLAVDTVNAMLSPTGERPTRTGREQPIYRGRKLSPEQNEVNRTARELQKAQAAATKEWGTDKYARKVGVATFREIVLENAKRSVAEESPVQEPLAVTHARTLLRGIYGDDGRVASLNPEQAKDLLQKFIGVYLYKNEYITTGLEAVQLYVEGKTLSEIKEQTRLSETKIAWHVGAFITKMHDADYHGRLASTTANWMLDGGLTDEYWMGHNVFEYLLEQQIGG